MRKYYKQLYVDKFGISKEVDSFLEACKCPKLIQEVREKQNCNYYNHLKLLSKHKNPKYNVVFHIGCWNRKRMLVEKLVKSKKCLELI